MDEPWYIVILFVSAVIIYLYRRSIIKKKPSLPLGYKLVYSDQKHKRADENIIYSKLLMSKKYMLSGKPDFVYERNGKYIPIELKSAEIGNLARPRQGDLMQLIAYFLIIEDLYGSRPKQGRLIYSDYMFKIRNTYALRKELIKTVERMRNILESGEGFSDSSKSVGFGKCRYCMCRETVCDLGTQHKTRKRSAKK